MVLCYGICHCVPSTVKFIPADQPVCVSSNLGLLGCDCPKCGKFGRSFSSRQSHDALNPCQLRSMQISTASQIEIPALSACFLQAVELRLVNYALLALRCAIKSFASCPVIPNCSSNISDSLFLRSFF